MKKHILNKGLFLFLFSIVSSGAWSQSTPKELDDKMRQIMQLIRYRYVEKVDEDKLVETGIVNMLKDLDPHSVYISKKDVERANEPLVGNFDGIGVSFQIMKDTIHIVDVIAGGPSEKIGLQVGDKIVSIDGLKATGDTISNNFVFTHLRGKKGTIVNVGIARRGSKEVLEYKITRDKIPLNSIDTYFMADKEIGYIRLDRFARTSMDEFQTAVNNLKAQGMQHLMLDLRGNSGGFLDIAIALADEFIGKDSLLVYTEGVSVPRTEAKGTSIGSMQKGRIVVLIDENSASASEIVSGAIQDWDRGILVGRRSFGKGLVQQMFPIVDGSQVRLTTSRYYTPSGRCIQKSYENGLDDYYSDYMKRYRHGEFLTADSIKFADSLKYYTHNKRVVYGGGGIMPDVFVPIDTIRASDYFIDLRRTGVMNNFCLEYTDAHRAELLQKYPTVKDFKLQFDQTPMMKEFTAYAEKNNVKAHSIKTDRVQRFFADYLQSYIGDSTHAQTDVSYNEYVSRLLSNKDFMNKVSAEAQKADKETLVLDENSSKFISSQVSALIARHLYGISAAYEVTKDLDDGYKTALEVIKNTAMFKKKGIQYQ